VVRIGHQAARALDRYIRVRYRYAQAWRPQSCGLGGEQPRAGDRERDLPDDRPARPEPPHPSRLETDACQRVRRYSQRGKGGRERIVKISYQAARAVDRYLRVRARHPLAGRPELWLGIGGRGPVTPDGIYQIVAHVGKRAGVGVYPHRFRHHFSHTWLDRGGAGGDLMELNGWTSPQMLGWYGGSARGARALPQLRPDHEQLTGAPPGSRRAR
jgi:integrase